MNHLLYVVLLAELTPGERIAQAAHGVSRFAVHHTSAAARWFAEGETIACVTVGSDDALDRLRFCLLASNVEVFVFNEPDKGGRATVLVAAPSPATTRLCRRLPLA